MNLDNYEPVVRIVVIGVGGAGNNAVGRMLDDNIPSVEFYVANTDLQALSSSRCENKILLGPEHAKGLGAGGNPSEGAKLTELASDRLREIIRGADIVFIAAGMGGGTGTGGAPIIAKIAKEEKALTVAIVTMPFAFEGEKRKQNSIQGLEKLKQEADAIVIVYNEKSLLYSGALTTQDAFEKTDSVLSESVKTVVNLIVVKMNINMDFADIMTVLKGGGVTIISHGEGQGINKIEDAVDSTLLNPLLDDSINGANKAIIAVTCGPKVTLNEIQEIITRIKTQMGQTSDIKFGLSNNSYMEDKVHISLIVSHFDEDRGYLSPQDQPQESLFKEEKTSKYETRDILPDFLKEKE